MIDPTIKSGIIKILGIKTSVRHNFPYHAFLTFRRHMKVSEFYKVYGMGRILLIMGIILGFLACTIKSYAYYVIIDSTPLETRFGVVLEEMQEESDRESFERCFLCDSPSEEDQDRAWIYIRDHAQVYE